jgi:hypothetical protein
LGHTLCPQHSKSTPRRRDRGDRGDTAQSALIGRVGPIIFLFCATNHYGLDQVGLYSMHHAVLTIHCTHYRLDQVGLYSMHHAVLTMHCTHYRLDQVGLYSMHHAVLTMHCTHYRLDQRGASMGAVNAAKRAKRKRVGGKANAATNGLALTDAARHAASAAGTCDALDLMESAMNWGLTVAECNTTFRDPRGGDNSLYKAC